MLSLGGEVFVTASRVGQGRVLAHAHDVGVHVSWSHSITYSACCHCSYCLRLSLWGQAEAPAHSTSLAVAFRLVKSHWLAVDDNGLAWHVCYS